MSEKGRAAKRKDQTAVRDFRRDLGSPEGSHQHGEQPFERKPRPRRRAFEKDRRGGRERCRRVRMIREGFTGTSKEGF